ncbi:MAG: hypothetical protein FJ117_10230 [Deltaproteobacteria bacterium]|nr:hypothetical protein [Deltaproteobacteria bacterium]
METIYFKTVDPISQELLRSASQRGIKVHWDRYERLQPQDGFLRLGLSCPFGCLQGPCRIDPFGRGPDRGICGLDRDGMVAALLLRLTVQGALEAMNEFPSLKKIPNIFRSAPLDRIAPRAIKKLGGQELSLEEISNAASLLQRPLASPEDLIIKALRLGILTLGLLEIKKMEEKAQRSLPLQAGYGLLANGDRIIGVCGQPSPKFLETLAKKASQNFGHRRPLLSLGDWIPVNGGFLPCVCTSGEAELLLASGKIHLLIAGPGADPSMVELCLSLGIPFISSHDTKDAKKILRLVQEKVDTSSPTSFAPDTSLIEETEVILDAKELEEILKKGRARKLFLLGGADAPQQSLGWIPMEVASSLRGEKGCLIAAWGDAALWILKKGLASPGNKPPVYILDEQAGPLLALKALGAIRKLKALQVCFSSLKSCRDLAMALGLASLSVKISVAVPLPLWGSEKVRNLLAEKLGAQGGSLTHFDHAPHAQEILDWFLRKEA